jgi:hypothetical protein
MTIAQDRIWSASGLAICFRLHAADCLKPVTPSRRIHRSTALRELEATQKTAKVIAFRQLVQLAEKLEHALICLEWRKVFRCIVVHVPPSAI